MKKVVQVGTLAGFVLVVLLSYFNLNWISFALLIIYVIGMMFLLDRLEEYPTGLWIIPAMFTGGGILILFGVLAFNFATNTTNNIFLRALVMAVLTIILMLAIAYFQKKRKEYEFGILLLVELILSLVGIGSIIAFFISIWKGFVQ